MKNNQKLIDGFRALLSAEGYSDIATQQDGSDVLLTASRGAGAVVLHIAPDVKNTPRHCAEGGQVQHAGDEVFLAPRQEGVVEGLRANPALAQALNIPASHVAHLA